MTRRLAAAAAITLGLAVATAVPAAATATAATHDLARTYHCGAYFHGHTVRGYLLVIKGRITPIRVAYVPSAGTLAHWRALGWSVVPCQH